MISDLLDHGENMENPSILLYLAEFSHRKTFHSPDIENAEEILVACDEIVTSAIFIKKSSKESCLSKYIRGRVFTSIILYIHTYVMYRAS